MKRLFTILMMAAMVAVSCSKGSEDKSPVLVESITISPAETDITIKETFAFEATVYPENAANKKLLWRSDNNDVATVTDGKVVGNEIGEAIITAEAQDGSGVVGTAKVRVVYNLNAAIAFADSEVKLLCVANWDTNKNGELSYKEAAAVTDLGLAFENGKITSFDELQYFTALKTIGDSAFEFCKNLTKITIPNSVTEIGKCAFYDCSALTCITIPNGVTKIGKDAFYGCDSFTSVTIPDSVITIDTSIFAACINMTAFYGKFASEDNRCLITDGVLNSFAPAGLTEYAISSVVTKIGSYAFDDYDNLTNIAIPDSVVEIEKYAIVYCDGLTNITIPKNVTKIGDGAFFECVNLKDVYCLPETPPTSGISLFTSTDKDFKIHVLTASADAYKAADNWKEYANVIVGDLKDYSNQLIGEWSVKTVKAALMMEGFVLQEQTKSIPDGETLQSVVLNFKNDGTLVQTVVLANGEKESEEIKYSITNDKVTIYDSEEGPIQLDILNISDNKLTLKTLMPYSAGIDMLVEIYLNKL